MLGVRAKIGESTTSSQGATPDAPEQRIGILAGVSPRWRHDHQGVVEMRKNLLFSAVAFLALASAALAPDASAGNGNRPPAKAKGLDPDTRVKLPPKEFGPERLDLDNNGVSTPQAGPSAREKRLHSPAHLREVQDHH
jgi:hypothetical protein